MEPVERKIEKFDSHEAADAADRAYYKSLTPSERVSLLLRMMRDYYGPPQRLERVLRPVERPRG
jgi:hypothetical protein